MHTYTLHCPRLRLAVAPARLHTSSFRPPAAGRPWPTPADSSSARHASIPAASCGCTRRTPQGSRQLPQAKPRPAAQDPNDTESRTPRHAHGSRTHPDPALRIDPPCSHAPGRRHSDTHAAFRTPHADSTADPFHHDRSRASGAGARGESEHTGRCLASCAVTSHCQCQCHCQAVSRASCIMHARTAPAPSR